MASYLVRRLVMLAATLLVSSLVVFAGCRPPRATR